LRCFFIIVTIITFYPFQHYEGDDKSLAL
jgi:hypothetical protein